MQSIEGAALAEAHDVGVRERDHERIGRVLLVEQVARPQRRFPVLVRQADAQVGDRARRRPAEVQRLDVLLALVVDVEVRVVAPVQYLNACVVHH